MKLIELLESTKKSLDRFLEVTAKKEEEERLVDQKIGLLEDIVQGENKDFWRIKDRFKGMESWLRTEGRELNSRSIKKKQTQRIIECVERMKVYWEMVGEKKGVYSDKEASGQDGMKILLQANSFIRDNLRRRGWEYTPLGLMDFVQLDESLLKLKEEIRALDKGETDLKGGYQKVLSYQLDLMDFFYKPKDHLLTILDYQLKSLEARPAKEDEFFIASLIYFLRQNRYKVEPYLERFKRTLKKRKNDFE